MSCKICFNVLNYVFILFTFNLYRLVNFNSLVTILAAVSDNTIYSQKAITSPDRTGSKVYYQSGNV